MGKRRSRGPKYGGEGVLLLVLARSWFHHPNPLITVTVVLSIRVFKQAVTLCMCCVHFNPL